MPKINKVTNKSLLTAYNEITRDPRLSWEARGIFLHLYSLLEDRAIHESKIVYHSWGDGMIVLRKGIEQLRHYKYLMIFWQNRCNSPDFSQGDTQPSFCQQLAT